MATIEQVASAAKLSKEKISKMVADKVKSLEGVITNDQAIMLVAKELKVKISTSESKPTDKAKTLSERYGANEKTITERFDAFYSDAISEGVPEQEASESSWLRTTAWLIRSRRSSGSLESFDAIFIGATPVIDYYERRKANATRMFGRNPEEAIRMGLTNAAGDTLSKDGEVMNGDMMLGRTAAFLFKTKEGLKLGVLRLFGDATKLPLPDTPHTGTLHSAVSMNQNNDGYTALWTPDDADKIFTPKSAMNIDAMMKQLESYRKTIDELTVSDSVCLVTANVAVMHFWPDSEESGYISLIDAGSIASGKEVRITFSSDKGLDFGDDSKITVFGRVYIAQRKSKTGEDYTRTTIEPLMIHVIERHGGRPQVVVR